jgi:hypothetical protein
MVLSCLLMGVGWALLVLPVRADDATVLPKGVFRFYMDGNVSLPITKRFNKDGVQEDLAIDFNQNLNSNVFSDLSLVEAAFMLPAGSATFGRSVVTIERQINIFTWQPAYGITDRLSIGAIIPYWNQRAKVNARLDNSTATVGFNPAVPGGVAPIGFAGTPAPTTGDIQNFLVSQGFRTVSDWSQDNFGDVLVGGKYQYYKAENARAAVTAGVRLPTGHWRDPNNLVDNDTGFAAWGVGIRFQQDYIHQEEGLAKRLGIPTPGSYFFNTTFSYDAILPDKKAFRVCNVHNPICPDLDTNVRRDVGDIVYGEVAGNLGILATGLYITTLYHYEHKFKDHYTGDKGFDYGALAVESDYDSHIFIGRLNYSTLPLFLEKQFPVPIIASVTWQDRFAGNNNQFRSRYIGFIIQAFF